MHIAPAIRSRTAPANLAVGSTTPSIRRHTSDANIRHSIHKNLQYAILDVKNITKAWDSKGDIVIGNDVWIGYEAIIMAGVTIGDGAIIGTRAVVTKDVSPYTIVGGVPAKPIRKRFAQDTVDSLLKIKWWDWSKEQITQHITEIQSGKIEHLI